MAPGYAAASRRSAQSRRSRFRRIGGDLVVPVKLPLLFTKAEGYGAYLVYALTSTSGTVKANSS